MSKEKTGGKGPPDDKPENIAKKRLAVLVWDSGLLLWRSVIWLVERFF